MVFDSIASGSGSGGDADLAINRGQVRVDGAGTDDQAFGYLFIGQALCHDAQYLDLSGRQSVRIG